MTTSVTIAELCNLTTPHSEVADSTPINTFPLGVLYLFVSALVVISNGLVLFVVVRTKALQQPTLWVISHMAFWDFLNGIFSLGITFPSALMNRFAYPVKYMGIIACLTTYLVSLLFMNVATIVLDRLISLKFPLKYARMKKRNYVFAAIIVHVFAVCRMLLVAFPDMDFYYNKMAALPLSKYDNARDTLVSFASIAAVLIFIIVCSSLIIHTVKQRRRRIGQGGLHVISRGIIKLSIMSVLSAAVFCISFVPLMTVILYSLCSDEKNIPVWTFQGVILCILSNSIWNVLIYTATYKPFKESLIYIFCRSYYKQMLRKRHGLMSSTTSTSYVQGTTESTSLKVLVNKPRTSGRTKVPNHLFLASDAR